MVSAPAASAFATQAVAAPATSGTKKAKAKPKEKQHASNDDGTNVSLIWTAAIGLLLTVTFYAILAPLPRMYFRDLFFERGWVTIAEAFLMFWAVAILIFKSRKLHKQRESMLFDLLPESIGKDISRQNLNAFTENIRSLPVDTGASFLARRVLRGLEHYGVRGSSSEVSTMLSSQAELDNNAVSSSYSLLNVFIWAIPILGFIGTVQGLGDAVGNLSGSLEAAADVESIKKSLGAITGGLGVAFDTTLVALIMSLLLKFPASSLQKAEEDLLNWVEDYCNENLLKRLLDEDAGTPATASDATLQKAINAALVPHQAELRAWTARLREIGKELTAEISQGWNQMQQGVQSQHAERLGEINTAVLSLGELTTQIAAVTQNLSQAQQEQTNWAARAAEQQAAAVSSNQQQVTAIVQQSTQMLEEQMGLLQQAVLNLNETLSQLNGKQVVIQVQHPARKGWFSRR
ncbi:MotA/TolQ/ExbB proton channel family protein [Anatilimnocola sp. NA78]|uniref:MotA/TolQ/ExbB proton channel family protein n=1 Tax=Anatilimnocola sp. NA78 TaxID=3415683 RepID=UPI003CE51D45